MSCREPQTPQAQYEDDQRRYRIDKAVAEFDNRMALRRWRLDHRTVTNDITKMREAFRRRRIIRQNRDKK